MTSKYKPAYLEISKKLEKRFLDMMEDPMWPDHCEINKSTLNTAVGTLRWMRNEIEGKNETLRTPPQD